MSKDSGLVDLEKMLHDEKFQPKIKGEKLVFSTLRVKIQVNAFFNDSYGFSACYRKSLAPDERCFEILDQIFGRQAEVIESGDHVFHNLTLRRNDFAAIVGYAKMSDQILDAKGNYDMRLNECSSAVARMQ